MAISRVTVWVAGNTLTAAALNGEFNNILDNALTLVSPLTGDLDFNNNELNNLGSGTEATPAINFSGDTNTGIRRSGADLLEFVTAGADRWRVNASGHLLGVDDNTYDIGASGATRPRNVYIAGFIVEGSVSENVALIQQVFG